jgi:acyl-CoA thioesterase-1
MLRFCYLLLVVLIISCEIKPDKSKEKNLNREELKKSDSTSISNIKTILFFGNSLTAGMGLEIDEAFPSLIQDKIDSLQLDYKVINAGLSGETTASGKNRLNWVLKQKTDIFILELGANDGLRGIPIAETRKNLQIIVDRVKHKNQSTKIILAGMMIPPNMGPEYTTEFQNIFPILATENDIFLIPFILENVAGIKDLNQEDGIHPTAKGHKIVAKNVWKILQKAIRK